MALTEGVAAAIRYKFYASGTMTPNTEADLATDPGATGWTPLRRVSSTLNLAKEVTQSAEIITSRQLRTYRHAGRRVEGNVVGELSPGSYFDLFEAIHRDTRRAPEVDIDNATFTSVAADATASTFTFGGGDPVTSGLRVGDTFALSGLSATANNGVHYVILGFSGGSNRVVEVWPAPTTMGADTSFAGALVGSSTEVPSTGHVRRKLAFEIYREDLDRSRVFTECRLSGYRINTSATGIVGCEFDAMGRNMHRKSGGSAPYATSLGDLSTTQGCDAVNGIVRVNGERVGVVTALNFGLALTADAPRVQQVFPPDILLGTARGTGELTALIDDSDLGALFEDETEFEIVTKLSSGTGTDADSVVFYMPRVKASGATEAVAGEGSQTITIPFTMLEYVGTAAGVPTTTIKMWDTAVTGA